MLRTDRTGADPEKLNVVYVGDLDYRRFSELCSVQKSPRRNQRDTLRTLV